MGHHQVYQHMDQQSPRRKRERIFEEIMVKNFQNLMKYMNINTPKSLGISNRVKSRRSTPKQVIIKQQGDTLKCSKSEMTQ